MKVKFKKEYPDAIIPDKDTSQSACVNLYAYIIDPKHRGEGITINPHKCYQFGSGISVEIPEGYVGLLLAKGNYGIMRQLSPANSAGVIDPDYRGEVMIGLENGGNTKQVVRHGDKWPSFVSCLPFSLIWKRWKRCLKQSVAAGTIGIDFNAAVRISPLMRGGFFSINLRNILLCGIILQQRAR